MPTDSTFLSSLAAVLCVAALTTTVFQRIGLPVVLGYLLAGVIVGPHLGLLPIVDPNQIGTLSELGVILLMFFIGLEFSVGRLLRVGPRGLLIALVEVGAMLWLGSSVGRAYGMSAVSSFFLGGVVAIASTTVIAKVFEEQKIGGSLVEVVFATLIVEDLIAVLLLTLFSTLAKSGTPDAATLGAEALRLGQFLAGLLIIGYALIPGLMRRVVALNRPETTLLASIGVCFAAALAARHFGYSVALGAFLAGSLVAESGEEKRIEVLVRPVRDMFAAVFFVAIGMSIEPKLILANPGLVALLCLLVLVAKPLAVALAGFFSGLGIGKSLRAGLSMGQIGEFSFIIAGLGVATGSADPRLLALAVSVAAITTFTTPFMVRHADRAAAAVDRHLPQSLKTFAALYGGWIQSIVAARQQHRVGKLWRWIAFLMVDVALIAALMLAAALGANELRHWLDVRTGLLGISTTVLVWAGFSVLAAPLLLGVVRATRALAGRMAQAAMPLAEGGVDFAQAPRRALQLALELMLLILVGLISIAATSAYVPVLPALAVLMLILLGSSIAFWRSTTQLQGHVKAGSFAILEALRRQAPGAGAGAHALALEQVHDLLPGLGDLLPVSLEAGSPAIGQRVQELGLVGRTGATVLAVRRDDAALLAGDDNIVLQLGDTVVLAGSSEAVELAREWLADHAAAADGASNPISPAESAR
ncbi:MAG: potassium transporter [Lysobacterales bacterium CG02_land_8_20_14_3_00_62_12]|nr:MAG: potassium transporter [Xanthomonadales bacterium CG02_land_8_20_14_3_00_62_12]